MSLEMEIYLPQEDSYFFSEILENQILKLIQKNPDLKFLEIGCGSGIQLETALKCKIKKSNIFSLDINPSAVEHCKKLSFNSIKSNLFSEIQKQKNIPEKFDLIIFNPPYLPQDKSGLESDESKIATTGGFRGSEIINKFLKQAPKFLKKDGKIFLLVSSHTKKINWPENLKKTKLAEKNLFFEKLEIWELENNQI